MSKKMSGMFDLALRDYATYFWNYASILCYQKCYIMLLQNPKYATKIQNMLLKMVYEGIKTTDVKETVLEN